MQGVFGRRQTRGRDETRDEASARTFKVNFVRDPGTVCAGMQQAGEGGGITTRAVLTGLSESGLEGAESAL
jgi:hypothetical protein